MAYKDSNTTLTDDQYNKLKASNPTLASKYTYVSDPKPTTSGSSSVTLPVTGSGNVSGGNITLTPEQQAKVAKNNPSLAQSIGLPAYSGSTTATPQKSLTDAVEKNLPEATRKSTLVEFADALNQATTLARQSRQANELGILDQFGFKPGQVQASTMGQILNLLDQRSGNRVEELRTAAMDAFKSEETKKAADLENTNKLALSLITSGNVDGTQVQGILNAGSYEAALSVAAGLMKGSGEYADIRTVGDKLVGVKDDGTVDVLFEGDSAAEQFTLGTNQIRYDAAGNVVARGPAGTGGGSSDKNTVRSGGLVTTNSSIGAGAAVLENSRGSDGWVNSDVYKQLAAEWQQDGGLLQDFVKYYPPELYANPADTSLPSYLQPESKGIGNPFG